MSASTSPTLVAPTSSMATSSTLTTDPPNHLIVVCCHGIWLGGASNGHDESEWLIEDYKKGETPTFIAHIKDGVKALSEDAKAVLVFSGAPTRREVNLSEAASYRNLAQANGYFDYFGHQHAQDLTSKSRLLVEEKALDSYYNILFSIVLFWSVHKVWPEKLTIVSHLFKKTRLVDLHCNAIGFPREAITFLGTDPPRSKWQWTETLKLEGKEAFFKRKEALAGAYKAEEQWRDDPHGISELLAGKRKARNVWGVDQKLFLDDARRKLSGVETVFLPDGTESLAVGGRRPWKVEPVDPWEKMRSW